MKCCGSDSLGDRLLPRFEILNLNSNRPRKWKNRVDTDPRTVTCMAVKEGLRYINLCINAHSPHSDISLVTAP